MTDHAEDETGRPEDRRLRPARETDERTGADSVRARIQDQARWVDLQVTEAMRRGEFDDLPGTGKPLGDLGAPEDRDWWLRRLVERERITGVLPAALQLRKDDAELDALLDREPGEKQVRELLEDFNRRVVEARRQLQGGPPVVTPTRDVEAEIEHWRARRARRPRPAPRADLDPRRGPGPGSGSRRPRRRWFRRRGSSAETPD